MGFPVGFYCIGKNVERVAFLKKLSRGNGTALLIVPFKIKT